MSSPRRDPKTGTWFIRFEVGAVDGKRRQAKRRGFPTQRAAQAALDRMRVRVREGGFEPPDPMTLAEFVELEWLPAARMDREESTLASYRAKLQLHVLPYLGQLPLSALTPARLTVLYADLLDHGRKDNKPGGLSPRSVKYVSTIVHRVLQDAVEWGRLAKNPADAAKAPSRRGAKAPEMRTWTGVQLAEFLRLTENDRYHTSWLFLATTGVRRGEALGLRWADVDLDRAVVKIRQTITAVDHSIRMGGQTKTAKERPIGIDAHTVSALRTLRARQAEERLMLGVGYRDLGLVFCHPTGEPYHPERFSREFDRRIIRYGLYRIRLHDLRHTWATLALEEGVDVRVVAERLGHSSTTTTRDIYQHVTPGMASDAAERVARRIFGR